MVLNFCKKIILNYIPLNVVDKFFYYQLLLIAPLIKLYSKYTRASLPKLREHLKIVCPYISEGLEPGSFYFKIKA